MGYTGYAERCLKRVTVAGTKPDAKAPSRRAAHEALAYHKVLKGREAKSRLNFQKTFESKDSFYDEEEQVQLRKQAKLDARLRARAHAEQNLRYTTQSPSMDESPVIDWH